MPPFLLVEREDAIVTMTLNRPQERNAISSPENIQEIRDFCAEVTRDISIKVVIITGAGSAFCAGGNVKDMRDRVGIFDGSPYTLRNRYREGIQQIPLALYELEVPTIAAINGPAIGAGLDLACMCDVRLAANEALFAESFVRLGIVPGDGGAWLLQRIIGPARAALMALTGDMIDSPTALAYGLITEVVSGDTLLESAKSVARRIAANPSHALRLTKRLLREAQDMRLAPLLELSAAYQALAHHTQDHDEAVAAFLEKRKPVFTNT